MISFSWHCDQNQLSSLELRLSGGETFGFHQLGSQCGKTLSQGGVAVPEKCRVIVTFRLPLALRVKFVARSRAVVVGAAASRQ